jgi:aspartate-semialdehyde dehydrogenase
MSKPFRVGILGATGAVGQKFIELLDGHPWFEISALTASERSAGKPYSEAVNWISEMPLRDAVASMVVQSSTPQIDVDLVFSGLDAAVAGDIEQDFADAGIPVVSNARNHRMRDDVPLLIPEVNPDHLSLIEKQSTFANGGFIVTNPNCSTVGLAIALKPLDDAFGIKRVLVTTMQALSGAGYPGVASLDALGNVIPFIGGEEEKMAAEPLKILGKLVDGNVQPSEIRVSAQCNRVPVIDGHTECISIEFESRVSPEDVRAVFESFEDPLAAYELPSSPKDLIKVFDDPRFPQPKRHAQLGRGLTVSIGRIRACNVFDVKFVALVHNTVRGAAGGAILNAELLVKKGYVMNRHERANVAA